MTAHNGNVALAFEQVGDDGGEPLLLIMGLGMQMIYWPDGLLAGFAEAGFTVARFDNRDAGASTHLTWRGAPSLPRAAAPCPGSSRRTGSPTWRPTPSPCWTRSGGSRRTCWARRWAG